MKININEYPKIWFTSDWHLGHTKEFIYLNRGCKSIDDYNNWALKQINILAKLNDLIIHMGDMSLTSTYPEFLEYISKIKCNNIYSIIGNHDNLFNKLINDLESYNQSLDFIQSKLCESDKNIKSLGSYCEITIIEPSDKPNEKAHKQPITLCHYPMLLWNKSQYGAFQLCGHSHGNFDQSNVDYKLAKRLDCGVDNALKYSNNKRIMFSWDDIKNIMSTKEFEILDHHNKDTN